MNMQNLFSFRFIFFIRVGFERNNKYAKKVLSQPWNSPTLQLSLSLREKHDKIVFNFGRSDSLFSSPRIFCSFRQPSANLKMAHNSF